MEVPRLLHRYEEEGGQLDLHKEDGISNIILKVHQ